MGCCLTERPAYVAIPYPGIGPSCMFLNGSHALAMDAIIMDQIPFHPLKCTFVPAPHKNPCDPYKYLHPTQHLYGTVKDGAVQIDAARTQQIEVGGVDMLNTAKELDLTEQSTMERFVSILQDCRTEKNLVHANQIHLHFCDYGLELHELLGNYFVPIFVECASIFAAQQVFNRLSYHNEYSWTYLIQGYVERGESWHALNLYQKMQEDCVCPSKHTFVPLLKSCARLKCTEAGQDIHSDIAKDGFEMDLSIGTTLMDMYAKCGAFADAWEVFDELSDRDVVMWNALIAGYAEHGLGEEALNCLEQMQREGFTPTVVTFLGSLKACGSMAAIDRGRDIHIQISKEGLERELPVCNTLIDMYAKCGFLTEAWEVFYKLPIQDEVSWNAIIATYAERGCGEEALMCFEEMKSEGMHPDATTFVCIVKACGSIGAIGRGREIHVEIVKNGLERELYVGSTLVDMYANCGCLLEAWNVFDELPVRSVITWTAVISGYVKHELGKEALNYVEKMRLEGISPNDVTYIWSLKACGCIGDRDRGQELHSEIIEEGFEDNLLVGTSLVDMYAKCGSLAEAQEVFDELSVQDVVSWNALIAGYVDFELSEEALNCLEQMRLEGMSPNATTLVCILKACASIGALEKGLQVHAEIAKEDFERGASHMHEGRISDTACSYGVIQLEATEVSVSNALIDMYCKCGSMVDAQQVFNAVSPRDHVTWNVLTTGYARQGEIQVVVHLFEKMQEEGLQPDNVACLSLLTACSHAGLVHKGQDFLNAMNKEIGIVPTIEHYNCIIDLLGRAGQLDEVEVILGNMPFQADLVTWSSVLGACRKWGNVVLGEHAFDCALTVGEKHSGSFLLMFNIYADDGE